MPENGGSNALVTYYGKTLSFRQEMTIIAEIITEERGSRISFGIRKGWC